MIDFVSDTKEKHSLVVMKLKVQPTAHQITKRLAEREDMTMEGLAGRVFQWFIDQPGVIQRWVLGHVDPAMRDDAIRRIIAHYEALLPSNGDEGPEPYATAVKYPATPHPQDKERPADRASGKSAAQRK